MKKLRPTDPIFGHVSGFLGLITYLYNGWPWHNMALWIRKISTTRNGQQRCRHAAASVHKDQGRRLSPPSVGSSAKLTTLQHRAPDFRGPRFMQWLSLNTESLIEISVTAAHARLMLQISNVFYGEHQKNYCHQKRSIFSSKCITDRLAAGLSPDPLGSLQRSAPQTPRWIKGVDARGGEEGEKGNDGKGMRSRGKKKKGSITISSPGPQKINPALSPPALLGIKLAVA